MSDKERDAWIALNMMPCMTPRKFHLLLQHFTSAYEIWEATPQQLHGIDPFKRHLKKFLDEKKAIKLEKELFEIERRGLKVITIADSDYPKPLRDIEGFPPVLYLKGDYIEKDELSIAIVGTRKPSAYGRLIAEKLSKEFGRFGFTIVSGMALGIDTTAHLGALESGTRTLAVMGGGFEKIYPMENRHLIDKISLSGAIMTEFSIYATPDRWTFPRRNRIVSGMTMGTIVIEAPDKSGALITARLATEQGKEVFVVPGPVTDDRFEGSHRLIQKGAKLLTCVDDLLEEFRDLRQTLNPQDKLAEKPLPKLSAGEQRVFSILQFEPIHFNDVIERSKTTTSEASHALLQLEFKNLIKELEGKRYAKLP